MTNPYPWSDGELLYSADINPVVVGQIIYSVTSVATITPNSTASKIVAFAKGNFQSGSGAIQANLLCNTTSTLDTTNSYDTANQPVPFSLMWQGTLTAAPNTIAVSASGASNVKLVVFEVGS